MKFILVPMGSAGDVHPFVWLGKLLMGRGHEVVMLAQEVIREIPERAGIRIVPVGDKVTQEAILSDRRLWDPRKAVQLLVEHIPAWAKETLAALEGERGEGAVLVAGALGFGARIAAERWGMPLVTVHLQPQVFMSVEESPVMMAKMEWMASAPRWVRRSFMQFAHWQIDKELGGAVNQMRAEAGIEGGPVNGVMKDYWHSPDGVICLFPEWYARKATDWPKQAVVTRFPLYDEAGERGVDAELEAFLASGEKPIAFTAGSANVQAGRFFEEGVAACRWLGQRGILLTKFDEQVPKELPEGVKHFRYVPFSSVFPRCGLVVHHGGIGTMAQCFAAGVPQLITPLAHDQPDNAVRIKRLGVGDYLYPRAFRGKRAADKMQVLTESVAVAEACRRVRGWMGEQMPADEVAALVERMGETSREP